MKSQTNIFCVNFTGAFLYSGTVSLYFSPSLCRATRIKLHHSQGLLVYLTSQHTAACFHGDPVSDDAGRLLFLQEMTMVLRLKFSQPLATERKPRIGKYEVFITEIEPFQKFLLVPLLNLNWLDTFLFSFFSLSRVFLHLHFQMWIWNVFTPVIHMLSCLKWCQHEYPIASFRFRINRTISQ